MMYYTHFVISLFFIILFFPNVEFKLSFVLVTLIATFIPDIDTMHSNVGKHKIFRFFQFFSKHRGMIHSFTFLIAVSILLALFFPIIVFPFFLGYSLHLLADSFTKEGITPFWPYNKKSSWRIKTGGVTETSIFVFFIFLNLLAVVFVMF